MREAPRCGNAKEALGYAHYWQLDEHSCWTSRDVEQYHQYCDTETPTAIFIHGNRTDADEAAAYGFRVYRSLQRAAEGRRFRCEIWSWPSDRTYSRPRPDTQEKIVDCRAQSRYLAEHLTARNPESPICLIGYSFGSRIIVDALQIMSCGNATGDASNHAACEATGDASDDAAGKATDDATSHSIGDATDPATNPATNDATDHATGDAADPVTSNATKTAAANVSLHPTEQGSDDAPRHLRVMLLAAAVDYNAFTSGRCNGNALSLAEQVLVTENACDNVLRWYPLIYRQRGPEAMGYVGPVVNKGVNNVEVVDMRCVAGKFHDINLYLNSNAFQSRLAKYTFSDETPSDKTPSNETPLPKEAP
jgi:hypothetical protein